MTGGGLSEDLLVEDERIRVAQKRDRPQEISAERAVTGVVFAVLTPETTILDPRQQLVPDPLPAWHAADNRAVVEHTRADHHVGVTRDNRLDHLGDQTRVVLVIGVHHYHHVCPGAKGVHIARLLVGSVTPVGGVPDQLESLLDSDVRGVVGAAIVYDDRTVDSSTW